MPVSKKRIEQIITNLKASGMNLKFSDFDECMAEMEGRYDKETAGAVCATICRRTGKMSFGSKLSKQSERRFGNPRTDKERAERHQKLHPETKLPPRGTGLGVKYFRSKYCSLFVPIRTKVVTKSIEDTQPGDIIAEGFVSMPIKDLQGDVLELPALVKAKNEMIRPPHNLVWLDHESPYANPAENQNTPPIGKFIYAKIVRWKGFPALFVRMLANRAHPNFKKVAYELKNGFYNAFSMEFVPVREGVKYIQGKLANAISDIKYFATSLVRAPANEGASITNVYTKAFANSSRFCPVRVSGPGWTGQSIKNLEEIGKLAKKLKKKQVKEDEEEELETTQVEEEEETEEEPEEVSEEEEINKFKSAVIQMYRKQQSMEKLLKTLAAQQALIGKSLGLDLKQVDEDEEEIPGEEAEGSAGLEEQKFPEVEFGEAGTPPTTEIIPGVVDDTSDEHIKEVEESSDKIKSLRKALKQFGLDAGNIDTIVKRVAKESTPVSMATVKSLVKKYADDAIAKKIVVRKGFSEYAGPISEAMKKKQAMDADNGSIESQLAVVG